MMGTSNYELCRIVRQESICLYVMMYGPSTVRGLCVMVEGQILSLPPNQTQSRSICFKVLNILILCLNLGSRIISLRG